MHTAIILFCAYLMPAGLSGTVPSLTAPPTQGDDITSVWQIVTDAAVPAARRRTNIVGRYAVVRLRKPALDEALAGAPRDGTQPDGASAVLFALPLPDGRFGRFRIVRTAMLSPELAAAFPDFRTFSGAGVDDPTASAAFGWTAAGFHAVILAAGGSIYIDPYAAGDLALYVVYRESDLRNDRTDGPR